MLTMSMALGITSQTSMFSQMTRRSFYGMLDVATSLCLLAIGSPDYHIEYESTAIAKIPAHVRHTFLESTIASLSNQSPSCLMNTQATNF
jgi:hypothetical protein